MQLQTWCNARFPATIVIHCRRVPVGTLSFTGNSLTNAASPSDYFGSFTIHGGPDEITVNDLATENLQITVPDTSDVPDPASTFLFGSGLALLALLLITPAGHVFVPLASTESARIKNRLPREET